MLGAHGTEVLWGLFAANCARRRSPLHEALLGGCYVMSVEAVGVENLVMIRSFSVVTPPCYLQSYISLPVPMFALPELTPCMR